MRSCLGAAIQRKSINMIVLETVRAECECPNATQAGGSCFRMRSAQPRTLGCAKLSAACRDERRTSTATEFRAYMLNGAIHGSHNAFSGPMPLRHMTES